MERLKVAPVNYHQLGKEIADILGAECIDPDIIDYSNGCFEVKLPKEVRNCSVFVLFTSIPGETLARDILMAQLALNAVYESFAARTVLVMPYFSYARSDKKDGRMGIAAKKIAENFLAATDGYTHTVTFDLHAPQVEGFFNRIDHFTTFRLFIPELRKEKIDSKNVIVLPDDAHAIKKAELISQHLGCSVGYVEKVRFKDKVKIRSVQGDYYGKTVIVAADEVCSGGTIAELVKVIEKEVKEIIVVAAHGVFAGEVIKNLSCPLIKKIIISDTLPISQEIKDRLPVKVVPIAPYLAEIIKKIHAGESLSSLFEIT